MEFLESQKYELHVFSMCFEGELFQAVVMSYISCKSLQYSSSNLLCRFPLFWHFFSFLYEVRNYGKMMISTYLGSLFYSLSIVSRKLYIKERVEKRMVVVWLCLMLPFFVCVSFRSMGSFVRGYGQGADWEVPNSKKRDGCHLTL